MAEASPIATACHTSDSRWRQDRALAAKPGQQRLTAIAGHVDFIHPRAELHGACAIPAPTPSRNRRDRAVAHASHSHLWADLHEDLAATSGERR